MKRADASAGATPGRRARCEPARRQGPRPRFIFSSGLLAVIVLFDAGGCGRGPKLVPVSGKVTYQGQPLTSGTVMFQPEQGPLARAIIQPDGTFQLRTHVKGDGCTVGPARVRITCYDQPGTPPGEEEGEIPAGNSRIPKRYTSFGTSGLRADVRADCEPFLFELNDAPGPGFRR